MSPNLIIVQGGLATPQFHAAWRERALTQLSPVLALPARLVIADADGLPTHYFARIYQQAWGQSLDVKLPIIDAMGRPSQEFLALWP